MAAIFGYIGKVSRVNNLIYSGAAETRVVKTFTYESDSEDSSLQISNLSEKNVTYNYSNPAELVFTPEDYGYVSDVHSEQWRPDQNHSQRCSRLIHKYIHH